MNQLAKKAGGQVLGYGGGYSLYVAVSRIADRLDIELVDDDVALLVGALIWFAREALPWLWSKLRPLAAALYHRLLRRAEAGVLLLVLASPGIAEATDARIVLECSRTTTISVAGRSQETCLDGDEMTWLDLVVGAQLVAIQLTGERKVVELGASPALALLLAWRPTWWTATKLLLGAEAIVSATILDASFDHVELWTVAGLNLLGYLSIGIGGYYGIATRAGLRDFAELVVTSGVRIPI